MILSRPFCALAWDWTPAAGGAEPLLMVVPPSVGWWWPGVGVVEREMDAGEGFWDDDEDDSSGDSLISGDEHTRENKGTDRTCVSRRNGQRVAIVGPGSSRSRATLVQTSAGRTLSDLPRHFSGLVMLTRAEG